MRVSGAERRRNSHEQKRHTREEIIKKLREAEALIAAGKGIDGAARGIGLSAATYQ